MALRREGYLPVPTPGSKTTMKKIVASPEEAVTPQEVE